VVPTSDEGDDVEACEWYALCSNIADGRVKHPIIGFVPTCERCRAKHDLTFERDPRQVAQELAEFDRVIVDPTGVDCHEAYESAGDQA
jgi:hypothetical protein